MNYTFPCDGHVIEWSWIPGVWRMSYEGINGRYPGLNWNTTVY